MRTALVLGGGGVTGVAWEIGLLHGLATAGIDLTTAALIVGTSAGSVVGAQITSGTSLSDLYQGQIEGYGHEIAARVGSRLNRAILYGMVRYRDPVRFRRHLGRMALATDTVGEQERLAVIAGRLPSPEWPDRDLRIVAVNAHTGEDEIFTRDSGVTLVDAVAASCAVPGVWPPVTIRRSDGLEDRYIDGGMRSAANADLATGYDRIVVLAPITQGAGPMTSVSRQIGALRSAGATAVLIAPDAATVRAIGGDLLNPARRAPVATAGHAQAAAVADEVTTIWMS